MVGLNLRLVYLSRSSAAVTGMRPPLPPGTGIVITFGPAAATGGLVGYNTGFVVLSYATGPVTSDRSAGGLVGFHQSKLISGSYATGPVTSIGSPAGGLVGTIATPFSEATIRASYATGSVDGSTAGGAGRSRLRRGHYHCQLCDGARRGPQQWRVGGTK